MIEKLRKEADGVVVVDAGDTLSAPTTLANQRKLRARLILDAYAKMGLDAMAIGEGDRAAGVDLKRVPQKALVERAGIRIGIFSFGLTLPKDDASRLRAEAASLRKQKARLVIALLHGGQQAAHDALAAGGLGIDVAIVSHSGFGSQMPSRVKDTWMIEAPPQNKQLGELDLHIVDGKFEFQDVGMRGQLEVRLADEQRELSDIAVRSKTADGRLRDYYDGRRKELADRMAAEKKDLAAFATGTQSSWIEGKQLPLSADVADDLAVAALVKQYKLEVAKLPGPVVASVYASGYAGEEACRGCHAPASAFWRTTKHAHAWASLVQKHQEGDASCTGCHITGRQPGLMNVQCEACHGPGAKHAAHPGRGTIVRAPKEETCRTCHTPAQSKEWQFAAFRSAILGVGHGGK